MIKLRPQFYFILLAGFALLVGCGDGTDEELTPPAGPRDTTPKGGATQPEVKPTPKPPVVYVEELDQFQEYFKEQHDTSFSHVRKKNWTSFTAGKEGILTRIALYGKPHFGASDFYGPEMSGILREGNPDSGPKLAEWSLSRTEVVSQLAKQGLSEVDYGWIDVKMLGEAALEVGKTYYLVCERISGGKHWFGAFAFSEGNSYKGGRHWLHPEHDLVFRTYVGHVEDPGTPLSPESNATLVPPKPTPQTNGNQAPTPKIAPIPQVPDVIPSPPPQVPPTPAIPPGPPQPRLRSIPLPQDSPRIDPGEVPPELRIQPGEIPLPPPVPSSRNASAPGEKNGTAPRGLLPGLFRRP